MHAPREGRRDRVGDKLPRLLEATTAEVAALFGATPTAYWSYDEVSGSAVDKSGGGVDLTLSGVAPRQPSPLGAGDMGIRSEDGTGGVWQAASSASLDVTTQDFAIAGIIRLLPQTSLRCIGGKAASGPHNGWDLLTYNLDGRLQLDVWIAGAQRAAFVTPSHLTKGVFPFIGGRATISAMKRAWIATPGLVATVGSDSAGDLTNAITFRMPGSLAVAGPAGCDLSWAGFWSGVDLSSLYDNREVILARMMR